MAMLLRRPLPSPVSTLTWLDQLMGEPIFRPMASSNGQEETDVLALDVAESTDSVIVKANLPGYTKENVNIEVHDNVLTITAQRIEEKEEKTTTMHRRERHVGSVGRRILLPTPVAEGGAKAELKDGVLTLTLPKARDNSPRRISVS